MDTLDRLLIERSRHIAGDNDGADVQFSAEIESPAEQFPGFTAGFALGGEQATLKTGDGKR